MTDRKIGTREEWAAARQVLLTREKEHTRFGDELAEQRRELPWVPIEKEYRFDTDDGTRTLAELFDGRSQLLVHHFMFGPSYDAGCPICSSAADTLEGTVIHLNQRDVTFVRVSRAPLEKLLAYRDRMGWTFPWVSSLGSDFNFDLAMSQPEEAAAAVVQGVGSGPLVDLAAECGTEPAGYLTEAPGLSAFALDDGIIYHTYSASARGTEVMMGFYPLLDRTPNGRNETGGLWIRRHDEYDER
jgi:predicted dithiol-disulfide oxidoreductase (DUF899 family)